MILDLQQSHVAWQHEKWNGRIQALVQRAKKNRESEVSCIFRCSRPARIERRWLTQQQESIRRSWTAEHLLDKLKSFPLDQVLEEVAVVKQVGDILQRYNQNSSEFRSKQITTTNRNRYKKNDRVTLPLKKA
jgi:hypothetical protein